MAQKPIVIIGAGAAGLAAARDLSLAGQKVIIVEARDRIGGRIFTHRDPCSPVPIELGAEFVHGKSPELWQIAEKLAAKPYEVTERHWYFTNGKLSKSSDFWKKIESLMDEMKSSKTDRSFKEFLDSVPDDEETLRAKAMAIRYVESFHAANIERIGVHGLIKANEASDEIDGDKSFRFLTGYDSLAQTLRVEAEACGAIIHLNTVVKEIHWCTPNLKVICENARRENTRTASIRRTTFTTSGVLVTLPLGVLQTSPEKFGALRFTPELPETKRTAINNLAVGDVVKVVMCCRDRFWEKLKLSNQDNKTVKFAELAFIHGPDAPFPTWWTQLPVRAPILVGWVGGPKADRLMSRRDCDGEGKPQTAGRSKHAAPSESDSFILNQAVTSLMSIFNVPPDVVRDQLKASYLHDWREDPFARGAYSYVPIN